MRLVKRMTIRSRFRSSQKEVPVNPRCPTLSGEKKLPVLEPVSEGVSKPRARVVPAGCSCLFQKSRSSDRRSGESSQGDRRPFLRPVIIERFQRPYRIVRPARIPRQRHRYSHHGLLRARLFYARDNLRWRHRSPDRSPRRVLWGEIPNESIPKGHKYFFKPRCPGLLRMFPQKSIPGGQSPGRCTRLGCPEDIIGGLF